jgi:hypothetical protein
MNALKAFFSFVLAVVRDLLFGWIVALIDLIRTLWRTIQAFLARERLPGRLSKTANSRCVKISDPAFKRPDAMIYDQYYLMAQGIAVTWDNPDIHIERGGVVVPPHSLKPNTLYEVVARIWNNSTEAPVWQMPVDFSYLDFGIGTHSHSIGQVRINLGVKGGPDQPAFARIAWLTPPAPGHYCVQVYLDCFDDWNPNNNLGQTNTDVVMAASPANFTFQIRNNSPHRELYHFEVDAYTIPPPPPCERRQPSADPGAGARYVPGTVFGVPPQHDRRNLPQAVGWLVDFNPSSPALAPGDEITIHTSANPPAGFHGRQPLNINAFSSGDLAGGVTVYVDVP